MAAGSWVRSVVVAPIISLVTLALGGSPAHAGEAVLGPVTFQRANGTPAAVSQTFEVTEPARGFVFKVYNGGLEDAAYELVSSSTVTLNGVEILGPGNFNQSVTYLQVPVALQAQNSLAVEVRGKPGGAIVVVVEPVVVIDSPEAGAVLGDHSVAVAGHVNAAATSVLVNGVTATLSGMSFSVSALPLAEGANTIVATAAGAHGLAGTASVAVTLDTAAPAVTIEYPPDGLVTNQIVVPAYTVSDAQDPAPTVSVSPAPPYAAEGPYQMTVTVTDWVGHSAAATRSFLIDTSPPEVTALFPAPGAETEDPQVAIVATFGDALSGVDVTSVALSLDGAEVTPPAEVTALGVRYVPDVALAAGMHEVLLTLRDLAGNAQASSWSFTVQAPLPSGVHAELAASPASVGLGESLLLTWSTTGAERVVIEPGVGEVAASGAVTVAPTATTRYRITAVGPQGVGSATLLAEVRASVVPIPEGQFGEQYQDLVPGDATIGAYDQRRFSLVTGTVRGPDGAPIAGVVASVHGRPQLGTGRTDEGGGWTLPVEGGQVLTVDMRKDGYLPAQRQVHVGWNAIAAVDAVVLLPADAAATTIRLDGDPQTTLVHQSTAVEDAAGRRAATLVLTGDTQVFARTEAGEVPVTSFDLRATEYAVPEAMPARLPETSAYTYCVDLSAAGLERVRFSKPAALWVDNFLGFAVGEAVPVGYYDFELAQWVPSENGRVVALLDRDGDGVVDALDATGDGLADDLDGDGDLAGEVRGLDDPTRYPPGATFWRALITHLTPWDCNWPYGCRYGGCKDPNPSAGPSDDTQRGVGGACGPGPGGPDGATAFNSYAEDMGRIYHDDIAIPDTDLELHYSSARVAGHKTIIIVPASGSAPVHPDLQGILVQVHVAGRILEATLPAAPNQVASLSWDGLDHLGRPVRDALLAKVRIGFVYKAYYFSAFASWLQSFATLSSRPTDVRSRLEIVTWKDAEIRIHPTSRLGSIAEGWTVSGHHAIVPSDPATLHKGGGTSVRQDLRAFSAYGPGYPDVYRDSFCGPGGIAVDGTGNLYLSDTCVHRVLKVSPAGAVSTFAGRREDPAYGGGFSGDGGPATGARLRSPSSLAVDAAGNVYISDKGNARIRKVDARGVITTVAGTGQGGASADNTPAIQATVSTYWETGNAVAADAAGNLYFTEGWSGAATYRIRKLSPDGLLTTVATLTPVWPKTYMGGPIGVTADAAGNLYVSHNTPYGSIRRYGTDGSVLTVAGGGTNATGEGIPATQARLGNVGAIAIDRAGTIYFTDAARGLLRVDPGGTLTSLPGVWRPTGLALDPMGELYALSAEAGRAYKLSTPASTQAVGAGSQLFFSEEGRGHLFSLAGRHEATIDLETRATLVSFGYEGGLLTSIVDRHGNATAVLRGADGTPYAVVAPNGQRTDLLVEGGQLRRVTFPDQSGYEMLYDEGGLMTQKWDPRRNRFEHRYTAEGRVSELLDPEGGHWRWTRWLDADGGVRTEIASAEGQVRAYRETLSAGGLYTGATTEPDGSRGTYQRSGDGWRVTQSLACGMSRTQVYGLDPVWKSRFVRELSELTPAGRTRKSTVERLYQDTDGDGAADRVTETLVTNGKSARRVNDTLAGVLTLTSPLGRTITASYDRGTLLASEVAAPGLLPLALEYDARGELTAASVGGRRTEVFYDGLGNVDYVVGADGQTNDYTYDAMGRLLAESGPDGWSVGYAYDENGNVTALTKPSAVAYGFAYTANDQRLTMAHPLSGSYRYLYDRDRRLQSVTAPSGETITNVYQEGNLAATITPEGATSYEYLCAGRLASAGRGSEEVAFDFDGSLVTSDVRRGTLSQAIGYGYDGFFRVSSRTYAGAATSLGYDDDGLLVSAGGYGIARNAQNGLPEGLAGQGLAQARAFSAYGELEGISANVAGSAVYAWSVPQRDGVGRILRRDETLGGTTTSWEYAYTASGRLMEVKRDGEVVESYSYDDNGNRQTETNLLRGSAGRTYGYSVEDHVLTAGTDGYVFDVDGYLQSRTGGEGTTHYQYSSRGELLRVWQPDGTILTYVHDPFGRRIAKEVDGTIVEKYLWADRTTLLALYDGNDNLLQRYEYADARVPVSMTAGGATYFLLTDQVGTLRAVADTSGAIVKRIDYDSFGNIVADSNPGFSVPFGFAGGLHDRDTGLVRFGYRDYSPELGRFVAKDPIDFAGGDTNLYAYSMSDPVNFVDPEGLDPQVPAEEGGHFEDVNPVTRCHVNPKRNPCENLTEGLIIVGGLTGACGSILNSNRYFRIGWGRHGGDRVFRAAGEIVEKINKLLGRDGSHWDFWKGGRM